MRSSKFVLLMFGIWLLSFAINLFQNQWLVYPGAEIWSDMHFYVDRAERIAAGGPPNILDPFYPPGAPHFYSLFFLILPRDLALQAMSVAIAAMLASANIFLGLSAAAVFRREQFAAWVAAAAALYWPFSTYGSFFLSEPIFIFFLHAAQLLFALGATTRDRRGAGRLIYGSGVLFAIAATVRTQALLTSICFLLTASLFRRGFARRSTAMLAAGLLTVLLPYSFRHGAFEPKISNNDAYVFYLGQTRYAGLGGLEPDRGFAYYFANNNVMSGMKFFPPMLIDASLNDRGYLIREGLRLWHESPGRQLLRSAENLIELFTIQPTWPLLSRSEYRAVDLAFQWIGCVLFVLPALCAVVVCILRKPRRFQGLFFALPIAGIGAVAFCGTGQPRYLLPFYYNFIPLAGIQYARWFASFRSPVLRRKVILECGAGALGITALIFAARDVRERYEATVPPLVDGRQDDYRTLGSLSPQPDRLRPVYWFEPSPPTRAGKFGTERSLLPGCDVEQSGFLRFRRVNRGVPFVLETKSVGKLRIFLPHRSVTHVAVYMVDPDSVSRIAIVTSAADRRPAQGLHDGKWYSFAITAEEQERGVKEILFERIFGDSVAVSAVVVYAERDAGGTR